MIKAEPNPQLEDLPHELRKIIPELRKTHGPVLYYVAEFGGVLLSPLTRGELIQHELNESVSDVLQSRAVIIHDHTVYPAWDKLVENVSIRGLHALYDALVDISGFRNPDAFVADLNQVRLTVAVEWDHVIIRHICAAFPKYGPLDFDNMSMSDTLRLLAQAEARLGKTYDGKDFGAVIDVLTGQKAKQEADRRARLVAMGHRVRERQRFFDWEKDYKEQVREERDVSDIDKPLK